MAFENTAADYERGRPGYPDALVPLLIQEGGLTPDSLIVDLGSGTGKLTRLLAQIPSKIVAIEPIPAMRNEFTRSLPDIPVIDATAVSMPFATESVELVTCGQSFRWFATDEALDEIFRVLRPKGTLVLVFNRHDLSVPFQVHLQRILEEVNSTGDEQKPGANWREILLAHDGFLLRAELQLVNPYFVDRSTVISRLRSSSQFARLTPERQRSATEELLDLVKDDRANLSQQTEVIVLTRI